MLREMTVLRQDTRRQRTRGEAMKHIFLTAAAILAAILGSGCQSRVPYPGLLSDIRQERYELGVNDCSNKAAKYVFALQALGYSDVKVINIARNGDMQAHSVVKIASDLYVDPTNGAVTRDIHQWGRVSEVVSDMVLRYNAEYSTYASTDRDL